LSLPLKIKKKKYLKASSQIKNDMYCTLPLNMTVLGKYLLSFNVLKRKRDFEDVSRPNDIKLPKTNVY